MHNCAKEQFQTVQLSYTQQHMKHVMFYLKKSPSLNISFNTLHSISSCLLKLFNVGSFADTLPLSFVTIILLKGQNVKKKKNRVCGTVSPTEAPLR